MTIVVKSAKDDAIAIPAQLMTALNLREGEEVKAVIDGETLRLARLSSFLTHLTQAPGFTAENAESAEGNTQKSLRSPRTLR